MTEKYHVLMISNMYPSDEYKSFGVYVKNIYEYLKMMGVRVELVAKTRKTGSKAETFFGYIQIIKKLIPKIFEEVDIVHLHFVFPLIYVLPFFKIFKPTRKLLVTFHGSDFEKIASSRLHLFFVKWIIRVFRISVVAVSNGLSRKLLGAGLASDVTCISAGIDERVFKKHDVVKRYDLIFVGNLIELKGIRELAKAAKLVKLPRRLKICIVGDGPLRSVFEDCEAVEYNLAGAVDQIELPKLLCASKFLVLPSYREGFGLVVSEAMFCGIPVIIRDIAGPNEQVDPNSNGFSFPENASMVQFAAVIANALNCSPDQYKSLAKEAMASNKHHTLKNVAHSYDEMYRRL